MKKQPARKSASGSSARKPRNPDAIALLRADHAKVKKMFKDFKKTDDNDKKLKIATVICHELTVHTTLEEEIFYPAARQVLAEDDLLDEADVEHASAKDLIAQIEAGSPDQDHWEAKVVVLGEYINHHVEEEHEELFPKVKKTKLDLKLLGGRILARKEELTASDR